MDMQTWLNQHFTPWQQEMEQRAKDRDLYSKLVKQNATAIKHMVGLVYDGQGTKAATAWNALGFPGGLKSINLAQDGQWLEITPQQGERLAIPLDNLLEVLNELLGA